MAEHAATLEAGVVAEDRIAVATQWQLIWWRFRKHKLAVGGTIVLIAFYLVALFADFFAYVDPTESEAQRSLMAPQPIHWIDDGALQAVRVRVEGNARSRSRSSASTFPIRAPRYRSRSSATESRISCWASSRPIAT